MRKNVAIIGCGAVGIRHAIGLREAGANVVGAVAKSYESRARILNELSIPVFETAEQLLKGFPLDAVVVSSPNYAHPLHVLAALESGCHVLCEKPMATNSQDARQMWQTSIDVGKCLMIAYNLRFARHTRIAAGICKEGRLGRVYHAKCGWIRRRAIPGLGKWYTTEKLAGGGAMIDAGIHPLDIAWFLMGKPTPVFVSANTYSLFENRLQEYTYEQMWGGSPNYAGQMDVEDFCSAFVRFENGASLQIEVAWAANTPEEDCYCTLYGEKGGLAWFKQNGLEIFDKTGKRTFVCNQASPFPFSSGNYNRKIIGGMSEFLVRKEKKRKKEDLPLLKKFPSMYEHFIECLDGSECISPARDGYILQCLIDAIYESAEKSHEVQVVIS